MTIVISLVGPWSEVLYDSEPLNHATHINSKDNLCKVCKIIISNKYRKFILQSV